MTKIAILGGGNIGLSLARGLVKANKYKAKDILITRRSPAAIKQLKEEGFNAFEHNKTAVAAADIIVLAVLPQQLNDLLDDIHKELDEEKLLVSVVSGVSTADISKRINKKVKVVRAMPNTAMSIGQSMTCIASETATQKDLELVCGLFDTVGITAVIKEELMTSATALNACGVAFFLRAIRAASQGGVEIGFHSDEALKMAVQTALGAAQLLLNGAHPESEIDKVTSPRGCTIAGLNEMEHSGFSSALIKGIRLSAAKAGELYKKN